MKKIIIDKKSEGKKIFKFIKNILPGLKNNDIFKLIRKKRILINNKKTSLDYLIKDKDEIKIFLKENHFKNKGKKRKFQSINFNLNIIFEDENLIIVNKPKGIICHPDKKEYKLNLYEMVRSYLYSKGEYDPDKNFFSPALCNRLDRNTSGLIIIAKTQNSLKDITRKFRERIIEKKYLAIVYGKIDKKMLIISEINSNENIVKSDNLEIFEEEIYEKEFYLKKFLNKQLTLIKPLEFKSDYSLIEVDLWTGKKHQIRIHMKSIGHPLLGDQKYFIKKSLEISNKYGFVSMFLHSYKLKINMSNEWKAPIPVEFKRKIKDIFNNLDFSF